MIKNILFDFDGVILDSMSVREEGFRKILENYDQQLVEKLIAFHNENGGLSRYVKIRYFFEKLLNSYITDDEINLMAENFSVIMKKELINKERLIPETVNFIKNNYKNYKLHIVSGSDGNELRFLCKELDIAKYFISIHGSPTHKNNLVDNVMSNNSYILNETILIGDSINDYEAASINNLNFYGFNNLDLKKVSNYYIEKYDKFQKEVLNSSVM